MRFKNSSFLTKIMLFLTAIFFINTHTNAVEVSPARHFRDAGMVNIQSVIPDIRVDMRYASTNNFIGDNVKSYNAPICYVLNPVAKALQKAHKNLKKQGYQLIIYDCYRPAEAVAHFVEWASDLNDQRQKQEYYSCIDKSKLLGIYIAKTSGHSRAATVDLSIMQCKNESCSPVDMGTPFDFFDTKAHTFNDEITPEQQQNRLILLNAMQNAGFKNYDKEWWHYTLNPEPSPNIMFNIPITE